MSEPNTLRILLDTKAKVKVCEFSRGGSARTVEPIRALDHDIRPDALRVPFGILELTRGAQEIHQPWLAFGHSKETSDFLADAIAMWWADRREKHAGVTKLQIELVYLPPYHSKYNPIERFRGVLAQHGNGTLLSSVSLVLNWARTATWRGVCPIVRQITKGYQTGVVIGCKAFREISSRLHRHPTLPKWSLTISPQPVH